MEIGYGNGLGHGPVSDECQASGRTLGTGVILGGTCLASFFFFN